MFLAFFLAIVTILAPSAIVSLLTLYLRSLYLETMSTTGCHTTQKASLRTTEKKNRLTVFFSRVGDVSHLFFFLFFGGSDVCRSFFFLFFLLSVTETQKKTRACFSSFSSFAVATFFFCCITKWCRCRMFLVHERIAQKKDVSYPTYERTQQKKKKKKGQTPALASLRCLLLRFHKRANTRSERVENVQEQRRINLPRFPHPPPTEQKSCFSPHFALLFSLFFVVFFVFCLEDVSSNTKRLG
jgi:hypothetical protein